MSTPNQIDLIEFPTKNPQELKTATKFFSAVFGWSYKEWGEDYSDTQDSGLTSAVLAPKDNQQPKPLAVIYSSDLEATKEKITAAGGTIIQDTYSFPGGRRFHFTDPTGNELAVWSE